MREYTMMMRSRCLLWRVYMLLRTRRARLYGFLGITFLFHLWQLLLYCTQSCPFRIFLLLIGKLQRRDAKLLGGFLLTLTRTHDPLLDCMKLLQDQNPTAHTLTSSDTLVNSTGSLSRRHSSPVLVSPSIGDSEQRVYFPSRKRSSLPPMPAAPLLGPTRLPSITEPYKSSWRLSFASEHRGEHLRKLSQGQTIPVTLSPEKLRDNAQLTRSLYSKGLRTSSQVIADSDDETNLESLASHSQTCSPSQDFGGVDGVGDGSTTIHLHEMGISQRLASRVQSTSSPQLSSWGSHERGASSNGGGFNVIRADRARYMQNTSDSIPLSERIPQSWGQVIQDNSSSVYLSTGNSLQPSRESSRFNLSSFLQNSQNKVSLEESKGEEHVSHTYLGLIY